MGRHPGLITRTSGTWAGPGGLRGSPPPRSAEPPLRPPAPAAPPRPDPPALGLRAAAAFDQRAQALLAEELRAQDPAHDERTARVAAAQLLAVRLTLVGGNHRRMLAGERAAALPAALDEARRAFAAVEHRLGDYCAAPA
ncbi:MULTISPECIES: hypothetical protein [Kitasatospora]|uniref:Uncharacterized protein n=1 Tax=Kitasatospora cathayae TaxID=3004092 RepID=A0ABY7Q3A2_9ACTN|nr:hypothetical protein [Kitasatospora sp. HUAS 3-15]WBP86676.1 hypothetical protein O1G21_13040 [Kitasatospora sp. HUAS 3-15]